MKKSKSDCSELRSKYDKLKKKHDNLKMEYYDLSIKFNGLKQNSFSNKLDIIPNNCTRVIPSPFNISPKILYGAVYLTKSIFVGSITRHYHLFTSSNYVNFLFMSVESFDNSGIKRDEMYAYRMRPYGLTDDLIRNTPDIVRLFNDGITHSC